MNPMTRDQLLTTAHVMTWDCFTPSMIRDMNRTPDGAEMLRIMVRDGMESADKITAALWATL